MRAVETGISNWSWPLCSGQFCSLHLCTCYPCNAVRSYECYYWVTRQDTNPRKAHADVQKAPSWLLSFSMKSLDVWVSAAVLLVSWVRPHTRESLLSNFFRLDQWSLSYMLLQIRRSRPSMKFWAMLLDQVIFPTFLRFLGQNWPCRRIFDLHNLCCGLLFVHDLSCRAYTRYQKSYGILVHLFSRWKRFCYGHQGQFSAWCTRFLLLTLICRALVLLSSWPCPATTSLHTSAHMYLA